MSLGVLILCYVPRPQLHCMRAQPKNIKPSSDIFCMEECKMSAQARDKMFQHQLGVFFISRTAIFQRRASFDKLLLQFVYLSTPLVAGLLVDIQTQERGVTQRIEEMEDRSSLPFHFKGRVYIDTQVHYHFPLSILHNPSSSSLQLLLASTLMWGPFQDHMQPTPCYLSTIAKGSVFPWEIQ